MAIHHRFRGSGLLLCGLLLSGVLQPLTSGPASAEATAAGLRPEVSAAAGFRVSPPVWSLSREAPAGPTGRAVQPEERGQRARDTGFAGDAAVQSTRVRPGGEQVSVARANFAGIENADNAGSQYRPDTDGDVGPNHYVQMVDSSFAIYSKTGTELVPPTPLSNLWAGFGGVGDGCTYEMGWPIVLHDQLADRWILTATSQDKDLSYLCIAVSTTADPTGTYYQYAFGTGYDPQLPRYGVWPDAYYVSALLYYSDCEACLEFVGNAAYALDRDGMLAGDPNAEMVMFWAPGGYLSGDGLLPSDLDGSRLPPPGSPNYFVGTMDDGGDYRAPNDAVNVFEFSVDFDDPAASSFTHTATVPVPAFDSIFPCGSSGLSCIAQPTVTTKLDTRSYRQRPTWRAAYRNFGTHEALVFNQSVEARPALAGVRWYELRNPGAPVLYQASTWAPDDGVNRWMGGVVQDRQGNLAVGYSVSNGTNVFPGIRAALRRANDPLNTLRPTERVLIAGTGSQSFSSAWGQNSSARIDPVDDCTFWYTNEYYETTGTNWQTRIGSFRTLGCTGQPTA